MVRDKPIHPCWLCGKDAELSTCKIDEYGKAVHESCYTARLAFEVSAQEAPPRRPLVHFRPRPRQ